MNKELISIITVVYNGEKYIEETIISVINQTYENVEYIIIDGGSTDGTLDIIKKYEGRIGYWVSEKDRGIYDAMNKGIDVANGKWIYFLGADDKLYDLMTLTNLSGYFQKDYDFINGKIIYTDGNIVKSVFGIKMLLHNTLHHQGTFYNKRLFENFKYDLTFKIIADYELNLKLYLTKNNNHCIINNLIANCRNDGISHTQLSNSINETNCVRKKCIGFISNILLQSIYIVKVFLHNWLR